MKVFVTDGEQRPALAIVRSLAQRGWTVLVGGETAPTLAASSKYCALPVLYPSPSSDPEAFASWLERFLACHDIDVLLPVTDVTTHAVCANAEALQDLTSFAIPDLAAFEFVRHKGQLVERAAQCGISTPPTEFVGDRGSLSALLDRLVYPAVVKPARSRYRAADGWRATSVHYADCETELVELYDTVDYLRSCPSLIQRRIVGPGLGVFALFDRGRPLVQFAHRRLREKPPSGGVSVFRESVPLDARLAGAAAQLLGPIGWHGVAMLEFKQDARTGDLFLMEVNGRFWGSLQLAIDAGIDFPWLTCELALGHELPKVDGYRYGVKSRWLAGDIDHLLLRLFRSDRDLRLPPSAPSRWQVVKDFFTCCDPDVHYEVLSLDDPGPAIHEVGETFRAMRDAAARRKRQRQADRAMGAPAASVTAPSPESSRV